MLYEWCIKHEKRLIYMHHQLLHMEMEKMVLMIFRMMNIYLELIPLNLYGWSKHVIDRFIWNDSK